jgi:hypothetical protein
MQPPKRPSDPCYYWKQYRLQRTADAMKSGRFSSPQPRLTDTEKVQIGLLLIARRRKPNQPFAVWIDEGRLRIRYGLQGPLEPLSWKAAIAETRFFEPPVFRKTVAVARQKDQAKHSA